MSETPCCYCGREIVPIMASAGFAEYHEICHRAGRHSMIRLRAEYAALEAAHDAALAEAERRQAAALHLLRDIDDSLVALTRGYQPTGNAERRNAAYLALCNHVARKAINAAILLGWQRPEPGYDLAEQLAEALARAEAAEAQLSGCGQELRAQDTEIEALQAQLAAAREDGARSFVRFLVEDAHMTLPALYQLLAAWQTGPT